MRSELGGLLCNRGRERGTSSVIWRIKILRRPVPRAPNECQGKEPLFDSLGISAHQSYRDQANLDENPTPGDSRSTLATPVVSGPIERDPL